MTDRRRSQSSRAIATRRRRVMAVATLADQSRMSNETLDDVFRVRPSDRRRSVRVGGRGTFFPEGGEI